MKRIFKLTVLALFAAMTLGLTPPEGYSPIGE